MLTPRLTHIAALTGSLAVLAVAPSIAAAGPVYPTANDDPSPLAMHSAANTSSSRVGSVPAGASVEVLCQVSGQSLSDTKYGTTALWDSVRSGGTVGYVTDLYVLTNMNRIPGVPVCGAVSAPPPAPTPAPPTQPAPAVEKPPAPEPPQAAPVQEIGPAPESAPPSGGTSQHESFGSAPEPSGATSVHESSGSAPPHVSAPAPHTRKVHHHRVIRRRHR